MKLPMQGSTARPRLVAMLSALALSLAPAFAAGGADLLELPSPASVHAARSVLLAVARTDGRLVVVGERGFILVSDDEGATWRKSSVPVSVTLTHVSFPSPKVGYAIGHGGVILGSTDGGVTWVKQFDGKQAAAGLLEAARKAAAGGTDPASQRRVAEAERLVAEGADKPFLALHFRDERNGLVLGAYGLAFSTSDGGRSWRPFEGRLDNPKGLHLYAIEPLGTDLYIAGEQGLVLRSTDGGKNFEKVATPYAGTYFGMLTGPRGELLAYGLRGNVFLSVDAGGHWQKIDTGRSANVTAGLRQADGTCLLVDEAGGLLRSDDGGRSFKPWPLAQSFPFTGIAPVRHGVVITGARGVLRVDARGDAAGALK